ncbi:ATP synthase subunit I [Roseibium sp.]|uniref:N-ATPase subunit AtpR n=1 Tax=Roseibium sp. TaxID=1936156 RepID=UPI003A9745CE
MSPLPLVIAFAVGAVLGAAYFVMLWFAIRNFTGGGPGWIFAASTIGRLALVGGAMAWFVLGKFGLYELAAAVAGFVIVRFSATRIAKHKNREGSR